MEIINVSKNYEKCPDCQTPMPVSCKKYGITAEIKQCPKCFEVWKIRY